MTITLRACNSATRHVPTMVTVQIQGGVVVAAETQAGPLHPPVPMLAELGVLDAVWRRMAR